MSSLAQTGNNQKLPQKEAGIFKKIVVSESGVEGGFMPYNRGKWVRWHQGPWKEGGGGVYISGWFEWQATTD